MFAGHPVRRAVYRLIKPLLGLSVCVVLRVRRGRSCPAPLPDPAPLRATGGVELAVKRFTPPSGVVRGAGVSLQ